jgi:hypothetical protein
VSENATVSGSATVSGDATVTQTTDYLVIGPLGSRDAYLTVTFKDVPQITTGCFTGTIEEFKKAIKKKHGRDHCKKRGNQHEGEYLAAISFINGMTALRSANI